VTVAFDAVGPAGGAGANATTSPMTWTHPGAASVTDVIVFATYDIATDTGKTMSATYGGTSMTSLGVWHTGGGTAGFLQMWALSGTIAGAGATPPATGSQTVSITFTSGASGVQGGSISFTQGGAVTAAQATVSAGSAANPSGTFTGSIVGNILVGALGSGSGATQTGSFTSRVNCVPSSGAAGAGFCRAGTLASPGGTATDSFTMVADFSAIAIVEVQGLPPAGLGEPTSWTRPWPAPMTQAFGPNQPWSLPQKFSIDPPPALTVNAEVAVVGAVTEDVNNSLFITDLHSRTGISYFVDQQGNPRFLMGDAAWALPGNAGRWNSGNWQADFDTYFANRAAQGHTVIYLKPIGTTQSGNLDNFGKTFDGLYPFQGGTPSTGVSGANPSSGLTASFWARIDYMFNSAKQNGITIMFNAIGYDSDFEGGGTGPLVGKPGSEWTAYGTALGARYKNQPNLIWHLADDYFGGTTDTLISDFYAAVVAAGDTHLVGIENMPESDCRQTFDSTPATCAWGTANAMYNGVYSYNQEYYAVEQSYGETSPITVFKHDGYFYQGSSTYSTFDRAFRQAGWWAIASAARGRVDGSESIWQWTSTALASSGTDWFYANNAKNIRTLVESLTHWYLLLPDTASNLVTGGRGTRAGPIASGGGGGVYEAAFTSSYVAASLTAAGDLALLYLPNHTTITVNQSLINSGGAYNAYWADPVTGTLTSQATGSTYNSTAKGSNSQGDPDWVLILTTQTLGSSTTANAGVATANVVANAPTTAVTATAGVATVGVVANAPVAAAAAAPAAGTVLAAVSQPTTTVTATAGVGIVGAVAVAPTTAVTITAGVGVINAVANPATAAETITAGVGIINATALQPTVNTSGGTNAPAGVAAAAVTAPGPVPAVVAIAAVAVIGTLALQPTVNTSSGTNAPAAVSTVTTAAVAPHAAVTVNAAIAVVGVISMPPPPTLVNAVSHPAVTGQTAANKVTEQAAVQPAVTQVATSSPAVSGG